MNVILEGISGSKAYGLDTPQSDEDVHGVFITPVRDLLGLHPPSESVVHTNPDSQHHELGKFVKLALAANPTIMELLWLEDYTVLTPGGRVLLQIRESFLSNRVRKTYGGYALSQVKRLMGRTDGSFSSDTRHRYAKHARHCFRLIQQGQEILETGKLTVRVSNREELFAVGELPPDALYDRFEKRMTEFDAAESVLPDLPDEGAVEKVLLTLRGIA